MIRFDIRNYRRIESAKFGVSSIAFVGAMNGNGKTSLAQGIGSLLSGERLPPCLSIKLSEAGALVRSGAADGRLTVEVGSEGSNDNGGAMLTYPKAEYRTKGATVFASKYAVGLESVLDLGDRDRGIVLARYLKSEPTKVDLLQAIQRAEIIAKEGQPKDPATEGEIKDMESLGLSADKPYDLRLYRYFVAVWHNIETGNWDNVLKDARGYGQRQKGAWESATGEKAYQPTGADTWRPKGDDWAEELLTTSVETLEADIAAAQDALEVEIAKGAIDKHEVDRLQALVDGIKANDLNTRRKDVEGWEELLNEAKADLSVLPLPEETPTVLTCPHCGTDSQLLSVNGRPSLMADIKGLSADENANRQSAIDAAQAEVNRLSTTLENHRRHLANGEREMEDGEKAKILLSELLKAPDNSAAIEAARSKVARSEGRLLAKKQKDAADKAHRNVQNNQRLIDILAPDGLRRTKLMEVVESFNEGILAPLCESAGWSPVTIDEDMRFCYGGFPFHLLAESHQYRVRVIVQIAMARLDSSSMVVIDGADILDRKSRIGLLQMVMGADIPALILATYDSPEKLPQLYKMPGGATYWLENGVLQEVGAVKAAAAE